jgi:hypothetical protein
MDRSRLLPLIAQLGDEFSRRNMADHLRQLRLYYLAVKHRLDVRGRVRVDWSADMVVEWMRTLRLRPYEDALLGDNYSCRSRTTIFAGAALG